MVESHRTTWRVVNSYRHAALAKSVGSQASHCSEGTPNVVSCWFSAADGQATGDLEQSLSSGSQGQREPDEMCLDHKNC